VAEFRLSAEEEETARAEPLGAEDGITGAERLA